MILSHPGPARLPDPEGRGVRWSAVLAAEAAVAVPVVLRSQEHELERPQLRLPAELLTTHFYARARAHARKKRA